MKKAIILLIVLIISFIWFIPVVKVEKVGACTAEFCNFPQLHITLKDFWLSKFIYLGYTPVN
jgi:hypothetical protein